MANTNISFKIQFGDELRRIALPTRPSFDDLRALIVKLFAARQLDANFVLKYIDDEGDHITLGSDLELECAVNALAAGIKTLRLIVSVVPVRGRRGCPHLNAARAQPQPQPQQQPQQQVQQHAQQVLEFLKSFGCPGTEQVAQKIEAFMRRVPEFKSADQFITEAIAEAEKLLANPELRALIPFPVQPENLREIIAPFLENPFVQQTISAFFENLKQTSQPSTQSAPPAPHFARRAPIFSTGSGDPNEEVHYGVVCDGCQAFPLRGVRHRCTQCPDYDLCQTCLDKGIHKETSHTFTQVAPRRPCLPPGHFVGRCGRRRGMFSQAQQPVQQQAEPPKVEEAVPAPVVVPEPVVPEPPKAEEVVPVVAEPARVEDVITPEETVGLEKLASMGFLNCDVNLAALRAANGDLWEALQVILQQ